MGAPMARHLLVRRPPAHRALAVGAAGRRARGRGRRAGAPPRPRSPRRPTSSITMVPDTPDVELVLFGDAGVAEGAAAGSLVIDMSTIDPIAHAFVRRAARVERRRDARRPGLRRRGGREGRHAVDHGGWARRGVRASPSAVRGDGFDDRARRAFGRGAGHEGVQPARDRLGRRGGGGGVRAGRQGRRRPREGARGAARRVRRLEGARGARAADARRRVRAGVPFGADGQGRADRPVGRGRVRGTDPGVPRRRRTPGGDAHRRPWRPRLRGARHAPRGRGGRRPSSEP